jgi:hypothetical protein
MTAELTEIAAPGRALIRRCDACAGTGDDEGVACLDCDGSGRIVWHACVSCGDTAMWRYREDGRIDCICGAVWSADDPRWLAQRFPELIPAA